MVMIIVLGAGFRVCAILDDREMRRCAEGRSSERGPDRLRRAGRASTGWSTTCRGWRILFRLARLRGGGFRYLLAVTGLSKGNLSSHLSKLEAGGLIGIAKEFDGKITWTRASLTQDGRGKVEGAHLARPRSDPHRAEKLALGARAHPIQSSRVAHDLELDPVRDRRNRAPAGLMVAVAEGGQAVASITRRSMAAGPPSSMPHD